MKKGQKTYADFMNDITADEIYEGLLAHGLFADKLPPLLTSKPFFDYCKTAKHKFEKCPFQYVHYENMRNINVPRSLGIPNPLAYARLCKCISDNWHLIQEHFQKYTEGQEYIISRIHLRKMKNTGCLFEMNYKNWRLDGTPEPDLLIGKRYIVEADISNCFPSIYTHSLAWALVGKEEAKANKYCDKKWYNKLDKYTRNIKDGETHGLLIGPHVSNLLSEIILCRVDEELYKKGWRYVRYIDDYSCYVESYEKAQDFLLDLREALRLYGLTLNHKKTKIIELPGLNNQWVRRLNTYTMLLGKSQRIDFRDIANYLDFVIELMDQNDNNAAILHYAIKVLCNFREKFTENAREYYIKTIFHLVLIYPYLVPVLDKFIFEPFSLTASEISDFVNRIYQNALECQHFEGASYAIYFSLKYDFPIDELNFQQAKNSQDCILMLLHFLYSKEQNDKDGQKCCRDYAEYLKGNDFESYWLFVYEVLPSSFFENDWKTLKDNKISFIEPKYAKG